MVFINGSLHTPAKRFAGYIVLIAGVAALVFGSLFALLLIGFGAFLSLTRFGTEIKPEKGAYREFTSLLGIRFGRWNQLDRYPFLSILQTELTSSAYSLSNRNAITGSEKYFEVYFLSKDHRRRVLINRCQSREEAGKSASELSDLLNKPVVDYNPARLRKK